MERTLTSWVTRIRVNHVSGAGRVGSLCGHQTGRPPPGLEHSAWPSKPAGTCSRPAFCHKCAWSSLPRDCTSNLHPSTASAPNLSPSPLWVRTVPYLPSAGPTLCSFVGVTCLVRLQSTGFSKRPWGQHGAQDIPCLPDPSQCPEPHGRPPVRPQLGRSPG